jgi:hypothetical protein
MSKVDEYMKLSIQEIDERIDKNDEILDKIWNEDDGSSWDKYKAKCEPYWEDNAALNAAKTMVIPMEDIKFHPLDKLAKECIMSIKDFTEACKYGAFINSDGIGYYAFEDKESNLDAEPRAFKSGYIRKEFTHVCWYNK